MDEKSHGKQKAAKKPKHSGKTTAAMAVEATMG